MIEGTLHGSDLHIGIVVASWNQTITDRLLEGAVSRCSQLGVSEVSVLRVPGALELPLAAMALTEKGVDGVVAIGTVVKGDTDHYEIIVRESSSGLSRVALDSGVPVGNAILAVHDIEHALERSEPGEANKGSETVDAVILTATGLRDLSQI